MEKEEASQSSINFSSPIEILDVKNEIPFILTETSNIFKGFEANEGLNNKLRSTLSIFDFSLSKLAEDIESRTSYFKSQLNSLNEKLDEICSKDETFAVYFAQLNILDDLDNKIKNYDMFFRGKKKEIQKKSFANENKMISPCDRYLNNAFTFDEFLKFFCMKPKTAKALFIEKFIAIYPKSNTTDQEWDQLAQHEKNYYFNLQNTFRENFNDMSRLKQFLIKERKFPIFTCMIIPKEFKNTEKEKKLIEEYIKKKQEHNAQYMVNLINLRWFNKYAENVFAKYNL